MADPHKNASSQIYTSVLSISLSTTIKSKSVAICIIVSRVIDSKIDDDKEGVINLLSRTINRQEPGPSASLPFSFKRIAQS